MLRGYCMVPSKRGRQRDAVVLSLFGVEAMPPRGARQDLLAIAMALPEPVDKDWIPGATRLSGTSLRVTPDTALVAHLRTGGLVEVLQAPPRGRAPAIGRPNYIVKLYPNADAPQSIVNRRATRRTPGAKGKRIPYYVLAPLTQAAVTEWRKQRETIGDQLDKEIESLETQLRSTKDRMEKKRLADAVQTALHADEHLDSEIAKRVYTKLSNSDEPYSRYVDIIDWTVQK
jgi:hypothetical protein